MRLPSLEKPGAWSIQRWSLEKRPALVAELMAACRALRQPGDGSDARVGARRRVDAAK